MRIIRFDSVQEEAEWVAQDISKKNTEERVNCAVLARTKKLLGLAGDKLGEAGIPVYFADRKTEFKSAPLRMLHAMLRLVNSREDRQSLAVLSKAFFELEGKHRAGSSTFPYFCR